MGCEAFEEVAGNGEPLKLLVAVGVLLDTGASCSLELAFVERAEEFGRGGFPAKRASELKVRKREPPSAGDW